MKEIDWFIEALAVLDFSINMYCFIYVIKTFNTKHCLNYIMCIDSSVSAISSLVVIVFYAIGLKNIWTCTLVTIDVLMVPTLMAVYQFTTANIRYKRVLTSMNHETWKTEKELIQDTNKALSLTAILFLIMVIIDVIFDMRGLSVYSYCMGITNEVAWMGILFQLMRFGMIIATMSLDIKCLKLVQKIRNHPNPQWCSSHQSHHCTLTHRHVLYEIPMQSTILNFGFIFIAMVTSIVAFQVSDDSPVITIGVLVVLLIKSPVSVFLTVRVNETNARIDKAKNREQRRRLEIEDALKKRDQRRGLQSMVQIQPLQIQDLEENTEQER